MVIISTVLLVLAATMYTAFASIGFSRQRDTATNLANQAMEQIKALNFTDLVMSTTDLTAPTTPTATPDPLVTCTGVSPSIACTFGSPARTIPTVSSGTFPPAPLYPHATTTKPAVGTSSPGPSTYTVSSYITFDPSGNTQARVATVRVTWDNAVKGSTANAQVQIESTIFANGPLASGAGHVWTANAVDSPGTISISAGTLLGNLANVSFGPGSTNASIGIDGSATATGTVAPSTLQLVGQSILSTGLSTATATSAKGAGPNSQGPVTVNDSGPLGPISSLLGLDTGTLGITGGAGVQAISQAVAASSATGSANLSGQVMPNSSLPYAQSLAEQSGPVSLGLNLAVVNILGIQLLNVSVPLLSITPLGNGGPDYSTVCQQSTPGCTASLPSTGSATGVGQALPNGPAIVAQAQKSFSRITVLPSLATPLLDIQGFTAAASAAAAPGLTGTGKANTNAVSVDLLGSAIPVSTLLSQVVNSPLTNVAVGLLGTLGVTASLHFGGASTSGNSAQVTSPLVLTVSVSLAGLLALTINVNFGTVSASASYS
jgi:hypothetical protein